MNSRLHKTVLSKDWDVESYYPSLAIANRLYPEHLGEEFVNVYSDMKNDRTSFKKGTPDISTAF
jgi:DNA polymerase elongation subunit (family B)